MDPNFADVAGSPDVKHHGDRCNGLPMFEQDGLGQWAAHCAQGDFEVTGCETRREAGARFYGGEQPGLYGQVDLAKCLAARAHQLRQEINVLRGMDRPLTRLEEQVVERIDAKLVLLYEFVNAATGELR
jgi:hypothetical protein